MTSHRGRNGAASTDEHMNVVPLLAAEVPTTTNGGVRLRTDGGMDVTWKLRPGVTWHDGTPFTSNDIHFTVMQVGKDPDSTPLRHLMYDFIDAIDTPDPRTAVVRWSRVNIDADKLLSKSKNSAFDGRRLQGKVVLTVVGGNIVHRAGTA